MTMVYDEIIEYLTHIDGVLVLPHRDGIFTPEIEFIRDGIYYGMFVVKPGKEPKRSQKVFKAKLKASGAEVCNVSCVQDAERVLERREEQYIMHKVMPRSELKKLMIKWAKNDEDLEWLEVMISKLPDTEKRVIFAKYYDRMPFDKIAREMCYTERNVIYAHNHALDTIIRQIVLGKKRPG